MIWNNISRMGPGLKKGQGVPARFDAGRQLTLYKRAEALLSHSRVISAKAGMTVFLLLESPRRRLAFIL